MASSGLVQAGAEALGANTEAEKATAGGRDAAGSGPSQSQLSTSSPAEGPAPDRGAASPETAAVDEVPPVYSVFTARQKRAIVLAASVACLFSPLTGQIYLPAMNAIARDLGVGDAEVNLTVTAYMVFQGITPVLVGALADSAGRRPAYALCFVVFIVANVGLAAGRGFASLLVLRCLQSAGSSSTVALCQAVVADIVTSAERGQYMALTVIPVMLGPSLGPVLGGVLSQYLGWRSVFWFLAVFAATVFVPMLLFFPETCRAVVDDGSVRPHPLHRTGWQLLRDARRKRSGRAASLADRRPPPLRVRPPNLLGSVVLLFQKEIGLLLLYSSLVFAGFYAVATAMPAQLAANYGLSEAAIGLMYLPMAGGSVLNALVMGRLVDWNYRRHARRLGMTVDGRRQQDLRAFPVERARLEVGGPLMVLSAGATAAWGWALEARAPLAVPCVLLFVMGVGLMGFQNAANVLLVDVSPGRVGAAVAANNLSRCLLGAAFTAAVAPVISAVSIGWTYVIVALLYVVLSPVLLLIMRRGVGWRRELREKDERKTERREKRRREAEGALAERASDGEEKGGGAEAVKAKEEV